MSSRIQNVIILYTSGLAVVDYRFDVNLESVQKICGGYVDVINLRPGIIRALEQTFHVKLSQRTCIVVDDEGLLKELPLNENASLIAQQLVVGDVIICDLP